MPERFVSMRAYLKALYTYLLSSFPFLFPWTYPTHRPNWISISSAVFEQLTAESSPSQSALKRDYNKYQL